jgi:hypothetical protein
MHPGFDRDYRHLLSQLIRKDRLPSQRRAEIESAIARDDRLAMVREAYLAMEDLASAGLFRTPG